MTANEQVTAPRMGVPALTGVGTPPGAARGSGRRSTSRRRKKAAYLFVLPAFLVITLVQILPMLSGVAMSLLGLTQYTIGDWLHAPVHVANYKTAFSPSSPISGDLLHSFLVTIGYTAFVVVVSWVFAMAAATFVSDGRRSSKAFRGLFIIPYAIPAFASIMTWTTAFQSHGAVNTLLGKDLHLINPNGLWLAGDRAFWAMSVTGLWRSWPFAFLMLLAALQGVPSELYEAARVDGASQWQAFWAITLPSVRSVSALVALTLGFWTFNDFATPFLMFGAASPSSANLLSTEIYNISFTNLNFGLGAAMSVGMVAFLILIVMAYVRLMRREMTGVFDAG
jgi:multiple sugar transport system permease protein